MQIEMFLSFWVSRLMICTAWSLGCSIHFGAWQDIWSKTPGCSSCSCGLKAVQAVLVWQLLVAALAASAERASSLYVVTTVAKLTNNTDNMDNTKRTRPDIEGRLKKH